MKVIKTYEQFIAESGFKGGDREPTADEIEMCKDPQGFTQVNHCKALGINKRADGTKGKSKKYGGEK